MELTGGKFAHLNLATPAYASFMYGKGWFCLKLPFLINLRSIIVNICEPCEQLESRANQWNYTHGFTDPLPYIGEMVRSHKHLFFEERRMDVVDCSTLLFRCLKCNQFWKLLSWEAVGQLELRPHFPKHHSSP
jgi:hypothetical protein